MDETERRERKRRLAIWIMVILAGMLVGAGLGVALSIPSLEDELDAALAEAGVEARREAPEREAEE